MSDLISRQGTLKRLCEKCWEGDESTGCSNWKCIEYRIIEDMPSADRPTGEWVKISPARIYECSVCGQTVMTNDIDCYSYCHNCGAKMEVHNE
jgi:hypothetical protein